MSTDIKADEWDGHVACTSDLQMHTDMLARKPEGKSPLERLQHNLY
jgi:hypothetical protein